MICGTTWLGETKLILWQPADCRRSIMSASWLGVTSYPLSLWLISWFWQYWQRRLQREKRSCQSHASRAAGFLRPYVSCSCTLVPSVRSCKRQVRPQFDRCRSSRGRSGRQKGGPQPDLRAWITHQSGKERCRREGDYSWFFAAWQAKTVILTLEKNFHWIAKGCVGPSGSTAVDLANDQVIGAAQ